MGSISGIIGPFFLIDTIIYNSIALPFSLGLLLAGQAVPGVCREWCPLFIPYLILASVAPLVGMMASVPAMTIILR